MKLNNGENQIHSGEKPSLVERKSEDNSISSCYFNPRILFLCKLCRHACPTVDTLFKHKRTKHTSRELQDIKFVIFEERFVHDDIITPALFSESEELPMEIKIEDQSPNRMGKSFDDQQQKLTEEEKNHDDQISEMETENSSNASACYNPDVIFEFNSNSISSKQNPFVPILRMNEKEIQKAKNKLKNPASRKNKSALKLAIDLENENKQEDLQGQNKQINKETPFRGASREKSHLKSQDNEFIILDIVPKDDGLREITISTTTQLNPDEDEEFPKNVELQPKQNLTPKIQLVNLLQPKTEENEEMSITVSDDLEPEQQFQEREGDSNTTELLSPSINEIYNETDNNFDAKIAFNMINKSLNQIPSDITVPRELKNDQQSCRSTTAQVDVPQKRYNTRRSNKIKKYYTDDEFECSKCGTLFFSQSEMDEHKKQCMKSASIVEPDAEKVNFTDSQTESETEWTENPEENSDADDKTIISFNTINPKPNSSCKTSSSLSKFGSRGSKSGSTPGKKVGFVSSATSFKQWLEMYKQSFPGNPVFLEPDPLSPGQYQSKVPLERGITAVAFPLKCKRCNKELQNESLAKDHIMICWKSDKLPERFCFKCSKRFRRQKCLIRHNFQNHPELGAEDLRPKINCPICNKVLAGNRAHLRQHMVIHQNRDKNFVCEICGSCFYTEAILKIHRNSHTDDRPYKCPDCPKAFKSNFHLAVHKRSHSSVPSYSCSLCQKTFRCPSGLKQHTRVSHTKEKPYACTQSLGSEGGMCGLKFFTKTHLKTHQRKEHPETFTLSKIPCSLCSKAFWHEAHLKNHMMTHTGVRPFKCTHEGCHKNYTDKFHLNEHLRTHMGEKPFQCDGCGKTFWKKQCFVTHCRIFCPNKAATAEKNKFLCHLCSRKFQSGWLLNRHLELHKEGKVRASGYVYAGAMGNVNSRARKIGRVLECEVCDFTCGTKKALKDHEKIHDEREDDDGGEQGK